jgi:hypothetical protein
MSQTELEITEIVEAWETNGDAQLGELIVNLVAYCSKAVEAERERIIKASTEWLENSFSVETVVWYRSEVLECLPVAGPQGRETVQHKPDCVAMLDDESDYEHLDDAGTCTCGAIPNASDNQDVVRIELNKFLGLFSDYDDACPNFEAAEKIWNALRAREQRLRVALEMLTRRLTIMIREWCEDMGDETQNSTPGNVLENARIDLTKARAALEKTNGRI